jgi:hypothetical protein
MVTLAISLLLLAFGAILVWGVDGEVAGFESDMTGIVAMFAGLTGALLAVALYDGGSETPGRGRRRKYLDR